MVALKQTFTIAGLNVEVFSDAGIASVSSGPVVAFFLLHGRLSSSKNVEHIAESLVQNRETQKSIDSQRRRDLIVITFDHRNHGTRLVDSNANNGWSRHSDKNNDRHALDMYCIQTGTARDVSFLIDFLPAYLYPSNERTISTWGIGGISLGGHSTWISLCSDPRLKLGIPIIGCPDFLSLMAARAKKHSLPITPPYIPDSLLSYIRQRDPVSTPYDVQNATNPFLGKKILVLAGGMDTLVPYSAGKDFVEKLQVGTDGVKQVVIIPDAGHECTPAMVAEMEKFIEKEALSI
ncbi:hypothetical protein PILCRDRAFT_368511 [Piloderma croceum F 1598]|uniref:Peptidase S9 prolyl oligopeptidase catalytic domain-containing protein n=1 Tax=Piloderma croceum (strain F 1598) TaxID=765440 RepID=A0A0C3FYP2_PILCF|nr:hypothetical protein PILCRDRAFT_368511 [Piloderma croceum F 1598]